ncbi:MAG: hypothetical protein HDR24_12870 [Lachnospiraceae bacterium]|nr:hypothetical protein [Lachnospiraceae bacterium]
MKKGKVEKLSQNATISAIIGALVGAFVTFGLSTIATEVKYHDAVTYNNISSYIDSLLVKPGLIDGDIFSLDNPFEQINMIAETMMNQQSNYDNFIAGIRECLIDSGKNQDVVYKYTQDELLIELDEINKSIETITQNNKNLTIELKDLKEQKTAILGSPDLKILGEDINTTLTDYIASIDGHNYYSENLLNSFLPEKISYDDKVIRYGEDSPQKINVISAGLIYDDSWFDFYNGDSHFTMSLQDYNNGIVTFDHYGGSLKIDCDGYYSNLSFTIGHLDNSGSSTKKLTILYMDSEGKYQETYSIEMYEDMPVEQVSIPIYNTDTIKIITNGDGNYSRYGLADMYLIK